MADNSDEILFTLRELLKTMRTGSIAGSGFYKDPKKTHTQKIAEDNRNSPESVASKQRIEKAIKEGTKALKDAFKSQENYGRDAKLAGAMFNNAVNKLSFKSFEELPKRITALTKDIGFEFKSTADVHRTLKQGTLENITAAKALHEQLIHLTQGSDEYNKKLIEIRQKWNQDASLLALPIKQLQELFEKFGKAVNTETQAIEEAAKKTNLMGWAFKIVEGAAILLGRSALDATAAMAKSGVEFKPLMEHSNLLGMSMEELAQLQNQNIQGIRSSGLSLTEFDENLIKSSWGLIEFTGSLPEGAKLTAGLFQSFRMLSNQTTNQLSHSIDQSSMIFKKMHDTVGETAEQFIALNQTIQSNSDIQVNMYRLNQAGRIQAMLQLQAQDAELRNMGLLDEEAKSVITTFAQLGAQGPKERRKQAAQLMAVGGALGMGDEARQLAMMLQRGDTSSPEFARLTGSIQRRAQAQYANVKG